MSCTSTWEILIINIFGQLNCTNARFDLKELRSRTSTSLTELLKYKDSFDVANVH